MRFRLFIASRLAFIGTYLGFGLLMTALVQLDLWLSQSSLQFVNLLYLWLLGILCLLIFLIFDYYRWAEYLQRLLNVDHHESLDDLGILPQAKTIEQRAFSYAWEKLYARLRAEIINEQQRSRHNINLVSQWAHHMKTPVAVIDLELQKARQQEQGQQGCSPEHEALLSSLAEENGRLQQSLQTLLNIIRLENFGTDFHIEPVNIADLVRRLVNDHKRDFIVHKVYPQVQMPVSGEGNEMFVVESDAKWLRFVLEQILNNAIKYSTNTQREGQVVIRCYHDADDIILQVADNGIGIAAEDIGRVFTPFYTGRVGRQHPQATGMGLYLAQDVCQRLSHQLSLDSQLGESTQVYLRFFKEKTTFAGLQRQV
jgi:signal transduction histidine kinase